MALPFKLTKKNLLIAGGSLAALFLILGVVYYFTLPKKQVVDQPITLTFWGVFDTKDMIQPLIDAYNKSDTATTKSQIDTFKKKRANVTIEYVQKPIDGYEKALKDAFAAGAGPDIFQIHNTDVVRYQEFITPLPAGKTALINEFFDVVEKDAVLNNQIYGLPLSVDSLALYYNKRLFQKAGITNPPRTWTDFNTAVQKLTQLDAAGKFIQSGAAIGGSTGTINRATDILSLLWLQQGTLVTDLNKNTLVLDQKSQNTAGVEVEKPGLEGLNQYLKYAKPLEPVYTWNESQSYSFDEFAQEKVAMIFSYAYALPTIRGKNPKMQFGIVPAPQIADSRVNVTFANYWLNTPSKQGKNTDAAWDFITFATNAENDKLYSSLANKPVSRRGLVNAELNDADLGSFAQQNLYATSWYQFDATQNELAMNALLKDILSGKATVESAYATALSKITEGVNLGQELQQRVADAAAAAEAKKKAEESNTIKK